MSRDSHASSPHSRQARTAYSRPSQSWRGRAAKRTYADPARLVALRALTAVREDDAYANLVLPPLISEAHLNRRDAAFATALTYGTLRLQGRYDAILAHCLDRPIDRLDGVVRDIVRLGTHQLLGMRVATHGAVSASVELANYAASRGAAGLVNAVLRRVSRTSVEDWCDLLRRDAADELQALADIHSHPRWIVAALRQTLIAHGRDEAELTALLEANNADPAVTLCARPGLVAPEKLLKQAASLTSQEHPPRLGEISPYAVVLPGGDPGTLPAVAAHTAGVEDEGSQLAALVLSEAPLTGRDERWLDMCAGPGGKTALLGARAAARGARVIANEVSAHRARLIRSAIRALPDGVVTIRRGDGRESGSAEHGYYDRILIDAPCSGLGSLRRRPESRWRRQPQDVTELADLQRQLLMSAAQAVRVGGLLAYVTCSPHVLETQFVVRDVMRRLEREGLVLEHCHAGNVATRIAPVPPAGADQPMLQLWPHTDHTDAMFCALLRRTA